MPKWPEVEKYQGELVHSEAWPEELDYEDKEVIVIGSGATAATIIPAMASDCKHITMLQRSPTYFRPGRNQIELAETLRELNIDEEWIHEIVRRKILYDQAIFSKRTFEEPEKVKEELIEGVKSLLPAEFDVETHFTPKYRPWRQRLAYVPDGDLFQGISEGKASVITDEIEAFTKEGILLKSQQEVKADIIVSATGFNMNVMGDIDFQIDDKSVDFSDTVTYRGMMFTGIPNMLWIFGYFRASWTLRVDLLSDFVCRLLNHMEDIGASCVEVALRDEDKNMELLTWMDSYNFNPGYLVRATSILPKRGDKAEWQHTQDYWREKDEIPAINLNASEFIYR
jgi:cation diffusion facilitator CzcD-associated flavoprotein CzcO